MNARTDFYVYALFRETGIPFYIGKGRGDRWACHERPSNKASARSHKSAIIRGMHQRGIEVIKAKLHEGLTEATAHAYEVALIAAIGRGNDGPLANLTSGGDGFTGLAHTQMARDSIGNAARGRKKSPEECANIAAGKRGSKASAEARANMASAQRGKTLSVETRAKMSIARRGKKHSPEHVAKLAALRRGRKMSAEWRANLSASHLGKRPSSETLAKLSAAKTGKPWSEARRAAYNRSKVTPP